MPAESPTPKGRTKLAVLNQQSEADCEPHCAALQDVRTPDFAVTTERHERANSSHRQPVDQFRAIANDLQHCGAGIPNLPDAGKRHKSPPTVATVRKLKAKFDRAHAEGIEALEQPDFKTLDRAIRFGQKGRCVYTVDLR
jgi:hypothetical protein